MTTSICLSSKTRFSTTMPMRSLLGRMVYYRSKKAMCVQCRWFAGVDSPGGSQFAVFYSSRCRKDVSRLETALLVEEDEERYSGVCGSVPKLSVGKV